MTTQPAPVETDEPEHIDYEAAVEEIAGLYPDKHAKTVLRGMFHPIHEDEWLLAAAHLPLAKRERVVDLIHDVNVDLVHEIAEEN